MNGWRAVRNIGAGIFIGIHRQTRLAARETDLLLLLDDTVDDAELDELLLLALLDNSRTRRRLEAPDELLFWEDFEGCSGGGGRNGRHR